MASGVYAILNLIDGKRYIGSSVRVGKRLENHLSQLRKGCHVNTYLQNSWDKYGEQSFTFLLLEECLPVELLELEQKYLPLECTKEELERQGFFNICPIAGNTLGTKFSEESRARISRKLLGNNRRAGKSPSRETQERINLAKKGFKHSEESKQKISNKIKGRKESEETKQKKSLALKGRKLTEETKRRISEARKLYYANRNNPRENLESAKEV